MPAEGATKAATLGGVPLDPSTRAAMEARFGHDFSAVRVHTDAAAADDSRAQHALAYTVGEHIVFAPGRYAPETAAGVQLLTHELTHVVQQTTNRVASGGPSTDDGLEREAQNVSHRTASSGGTTVRGRSGLRLARHPDPLAPPPRSSGLTEAERRLLNEIRVRLVPANQRSTAIVGVLITEDGRQFELTSGGGQGFSSHVEGKATAKMEELDIRKATLLVEKEPCQICDRSTYSQPEGPEKPMVSTRTGKELSRQVSKVNTALPLGSELRIVDPDSASLYRGVKPVPRIPPKPGGSEPPKKGPGTGPESPSPVAEGAPKLPVAEGAPKLPVAEGAPKLPVAGAPKLPVEAAIPKSIEGARGLGAVEGAAVRGPGRVRRFAVGAAGAAAGAALSFVALLVTVIWELIVVPYLAQLQREAEEKYRKVLTQQIQSYYDTFLVGKIEESFRRLGRVIKEIEDQKKQPYVNVTLAVHFDLSLTRRLIFGPGRPDSILDLNFRSMDANAITVGTSPVTERAEPLKADNATLFFNNATEFSQVVHFAVIPPSFQELVNRYGEDRVGDGCFIASACYGTPLAPQIEVLRRFRDQVLLASIPGRRFVCWYYHYSPPVAVYLERHGRARWVTRRCLVAPAVVAARIIERLTAGVCRRPCI
ncbi:hypothetical protein QF031_000044 [Pseudarthrobacter defluvii]|uniref:eCIS core domain-containing protein n=1 Tax=Pseudarthrobacter defluvii TaxID=410837 RepID=UPI00277D8312|nr:DUF4157 domain-containing protein [Pseudarthrobacter defluvii]MDQ0767295.1 hypothetical protein [Pseudarthrobacter defluvii]